MSSIWKNMLILWVVVQSWHVYLRHMFASDIPRMFLDQTWLTRASGGWYQFLHDWINLFYSPQYLLDSDNHSNNVASRNIISSIKKHNKLVYQIYGLETVDTGKLHTQRNMVWLTDLEIASFWTEKEQMGLDSDVIQGLMSEDIASTMNLVEFKK